MSVHRVLAILAITLLLVACSSPGTAPSPLPPPPPRVLAERADGALERIKFKAGDTLSEKGVYFLRTDTGQGEAWLYRGDSYHFGVAAISDDDRFVITVGEGFGHIVDRADGALWQWDPMRARLLLANQHGSLFVVTDAGRETGEYIWAGPASHGSTSRWRARGGLTQPCSPPMACIWPSSAPLRIGRSWWCLIW